MMQFLIQLLILLNYLIPLPYQATFWFMYFQSKCPPLYLSEDVSWKSPIFCSLLSQTLQRKGKLERKGKQHLTLILCNLFLRKQEKPFIRGWVFNKSNYLDFKLVIIFFWQVRCLTMVFWYIITIRFKVDIDYLHADKEWFELLVQHGSWLKDTVCKCSYCVCFYLLVYCYYNEIV